MKNKHPFPGAEVSLSRRKVLMAGAIILASGITTSALPAFALPSQSEQLTSFMQLSRLLVNHQLDDGVGQRMLALLIEENPTLADSIRQILAIAHQHQATRVEDFFAAIPQGPLNELAHKIIFGWYTGSLEPTRSAKTFAFEQALSYHTTLDVITIPSYGLSGPNNWSRPNTPVANMPRF